jgi:glycerol kinase
MEKDSGKPLAELAVDGGMCNSDLIMQVRETKKVLDNRRQEYLTDCFVRLNLTSLVLP